MLVCTQSATLHGAVARAVSVEVRVGKGLPDAPVQEARDRVRAALLSSGLPWSVHRVK